MSKQDVVVTSYGIVSSIGMNVADFEKNLFAGKSGVRTIRGVPMSESVISTDFPVPYAAYIAREELPASILYKNRERKNVLKSWLMTEAATREAMTGAQSGGTPANLKIDAIVFGTADGVSYEQVENTLKNKGLAKDFDYHTIRSESSLNTVRDTIESMGFNHVKDKDLVSLNSACATGNQTIGIAYEGIKAGRWNRVVVGGVDARCEPSNFLNFFLLGALTTAEVEPVTASRPFAKDRSGFVRGEGAAVLVMETRESAEKRGAKILGVVSGYGCTSDAFRLTDGRDDASSVQQAMKVALKTAGLGTEAIDYVNAHGTSTPLNDRLETLALKKVFGERAYKIPVSSIKSQIGHSTIAASAIEAVASLLMLQRQRISPTINYHVPDPECDLDYVPNVARDAKVTHVLSNSFGFGGQNTCVVFSKA